MDREQIGQLMRRGLRQCERPQLVETHISWVLVCDEYVYKIKKPVRFSFLDFSTPELRKYYCTRELELNNRLTHDIYLEVLPVREHPGGFMIGEEGKGVVDYAVKMVRMEQSRRMDLLLKEGMVTPDHIHTIARILAAFHWSALVCPGGGYAILKRDFDDLLKEADLIMELCGSEAAMLLQKAVEVSDDFLKAHRPTLENRQQEGFIRDCHGDLHSANIFLLSRPVIFDCIEFSDELRQIDVLNELAFFCMDLDAFGCQELGRLFFESYNRLFPVCRNEAERDLFRYYKAYRANVRVKISALEAAGTTNEENRQQAARECERYLRLMEEYLFRFQT